jgi:hypothetical protein
LSQNRYLFVTLIIILHVDLAEECTLYVKGCKRERER